MVFSIQSASFSVSEIEMGVSASTAEFGPWISVQEIGDQTDFFGSEEPRLAGIAGATKTSTWSGDEDAMAIYG